MDNTTRPWAVNPETATVDMPGGRSLAVVHGENPVEAARLMAAGPDMLHALNLALEYWAHRQQRYKNRFPVWVIEARAAIQKATAP